MAMCRHEDRATWRRGGKGGYDSEEGDRTRCGAQAWRSESED